MKKTIKILKILFLVCLTLFMFLFINVLVFFPQEAISKHFELGYNMADVYICTSYLLNIFVPMLSYLIFYLILYMSVKSKKMFMILLFLPTLLYLWMFIDLFWGDVENIGPDRIELPTDFEFNLVFVLNLCMGLGLGWIIKNKE